MRLRLVVITLLVSVAMVVPTVAVSGGVDDVAGTVELSPHDGPNGKYASVQGGEVRFDFERLNDNAKTTADNVLNITSNASGPIEVWVKTDVNDSVTLYWGTNPNDRIDSDNAVELSPKETVSVGFSIETYGSTPDSGNVTVVVRDADGSDGGSDGSGDDSRSPDDETTPTPTPVQTPEEPDVVRPALGVEILFDGDVDGDEVRVQSLDSLPADGPSRPPEAIIAPGSAVSRGGNDGLTVHGTRLVAQEDTPFHLTGSQSYVNPAEGVAREPRPLAIVDITPPAELRDSPALVRIRVDRNKFPQTAATDARIGRQTPDGWQLLPTEVVETDNETVLLEAGTPGFSVFTVYAQSTVQYEWGLPDGQTVQSYELRTSFAEPGYYNVSLRVTDAFDRSGTTKQQILVNDQPSVVIEEVPGVAEDDEVTLRANVSNEIGNTTTTWTLPNGSTVTGATVTGRFQPGDSVSVVVRDEFGGVASAESVPAAPAGSGGAVSFLPTSLPLWQYVLLASGAIVLAVSIVKSGLVVRLPDAGGLVAASGLARLVDDSPEITRCSEPRWNPRERRVEIDELEVSASTGLLQSIEVAITDADGTPVVTRSIAVGAKESYAGRPVHIPVYGDVGLSSDERYRLEIRAIDENDLVGSLEESHEWTVGAGTTSR